jgi:PAS domain S-box-containing protein
MMIINSSHDVDEILHKVVEKSRQALDCDSAQIAMREGDNWVIQYVNNLPDDLIGQAFTDEELPHAALAMTTRKPVAIDDALHDDRTNTGMMASLGIKSVLVLPLLEKDVVTGTLLFGYHSRAISFTDAETDYAGRMSIGVAIALQNARLYQDLEESKRLGDALNEIDNVLYSTQDYAVIMNKMLQLSTDVIGAESAVIFSKEGDRWMVRSEYKLPMSLSGQTFSNTEVIHTAITAGTKRSLVVQDVLNNPEIDQKFVEIFGIRSLLDFPLIVRGEVIGDLTFHYHSSPVPFNERQVEFVRKLQISITLALENSRLLDTSKQHESKLKEAENILRYSEERYRALFRDNPTMIVTLDGDLMMLSVNPACASQLGYTINELEGQSVLKLFLAEDHPTLIEQLRKCLQNPNQVHRWQFRKIRKDGGILWVDEIAQAVYDRNGGLNLLVVCQDITEGKQAEEEIARLNMTLVMRAAELEDANRELEAFNYTVAHDLRNPLNTLSLSCQGIEIFCADQLNDECKGYVRNIYNSTMHMNQLIDALLTFSRMGHVEPHREKVDLCALAQEVVAVLQQNEPERQIDFHIADGIEANGDANLLRVVLDNLLGNAWKYTVKQEQAVIEFGVREIDGVTTYFVRDNGAGFDKADADKLFVPFQRLPGAETSKGFGIGLATVERIIRRHGGRVWAEGNLDKGATFSFTLATN